jgi:hypothetical protein
MAELPEDPLADSNASLNSALEATAAILPWLAKPKKRRFAPELNTRWIAACQRLNLAWVERHGDGLSDFRPSVFALYSLSIEITDADCLRLGEALASATDRLEEAQTSRRVIAALSACIECLTEADGLEHPNFAERAQHFAQRLENCASANDDGERSAIIDRLFVAETLERLERMHDALAALPPDSETLLIETDELIQHAEHLALFGIVHSARKLIQTLNQAHIHQSLESETIRAHVLRQLTGLRQQTVTVNG